MVSLLSSPFFNFLFNFMFPLPFGYGGNLEAYFRLASVKVTLVGIEEEIEAQIF